MFTDHKKKINEFTQQRERLIQSGFKHQMMNTQQEQMHERRKAQLLKQVERQAKVGLGLSRLKEVNVLLGKDVQESIEFNERIEDPVGWKRKIKLRQMDEDVELQHRRDDDRLKLIRLSSMGVVFKETAGAFGQRRNTQEPQRNQFFTESRKQARRIF